jgi:hypothetical protein
MAQTSMMLIDSFYPEGLTLLAKDSIFMMPHLGVLTQVHEQAATEVFEKDCLIYLGSVLAPRGTGKPDKKCLDISITMPDGATITETIRFGRIKRYALGRGETASFEARPVKPFDAGQGPGATVTGTFTGGTVGVIMDCRGRPLMLPDKGSDRIQMVQEWMQEMGVYEGV